MSDVFFQQLLVSWIETLQCLVGNLPIAIGLIYQYFTHFPQMDVPVYPQILVVLPVSWLQLQSRSCMFFFLEPAMLMLIIMK